MGVTVVVLCVCVYIYYHADCYIPRLYNENKVSLLSFLWHFLHMCCVDFVENELNSEVMVTYLLIISGFFTDFQWTKQTAMASFQED